MKSYIAFPLLVSSMFFTSFSTCFAVSTQRASLSELGFEGDGASSAAAISGDGNVVAFASDATNFVSGDSNNVADIFVREPMTGETSRVSVSDSGGQANNSSNNPSVNNDGRFIAFESLASNLVSGDTNNAADIFVHDRVNGTTEIVSIGINGEQSNQSSFDPSISADGRFVAYFSDADNLVADDNNNSIDVFVYDRELAVTERVSVDNNNNEGNGVSRSPQISADGRFVTFYSIASNFVANDVNARYDVFVFDRVDRTIESVSVNDAGLQGNNHSLVSSISSDGRYVAFESLASNLVSNDTNGRADVFLRDRQLQTTLRLSLISDGSNPMGSSRRPRINAQGTHVVFSSARDLLLGVDTNLREDIYAYNIADSALELISVHSNGGLGNLASSYAVINADARYVAFQSAANNLVEDDFNGLVDVFVRDRGPFNQPPVAKAPPDLNIYLGEEVVLDGSASIDPDNDSIVSFTWAIELAPQGSMATISNVNALAPTFVPDLVGEYVISLVVNDGTEDSLADEMFVRVIENLPPVAVIEASTLSGQIPLTVDFSAVNSNDPEFAPLTYAWDFGETNAGSDLVDASYTYNNPGTYTVVLTVWDDFGNEAGDSVEIVVTALNQPPQVVPTAVGPTQGPAPLNVSFLANASDPNGDMLTYFWDFGDGSNSTEENPQHTFYSSGSYTVTVQVSDGEFTTTGTLYVAVESPLSIDVTEAEFDYKKRHRTKGTLKLKMSFEFGGQLQHDDVIKIVLDDTALLDVPFKEFRQKRFGIYKYKNKHVYVKLDLRRSVIKITKRRVSASKLNLKGPSNVMMSFGDTMATDSISLEMEEHHHKHQDSHRYDDNNHDSCNLKRYKMLKKHRDSH
ncbi:PKD domain-containing protein [Kaarinaea lacus]